MNTHNFGKKSLIGLSLLTAVLATGCGESEKDGFHGVNHPETWSEKDFAEICLSGVAYYVRAPNVRSYMSVVYDKNTLKPKLCGG